MTEIGTIIDGKYEILKEIGRGGMSTVYLAMDSHLNKQWAVKEIRKKGTGANDEIVVNSLLAEANLMKRLDHPALPRIVDIIDNGITIYVVMDYIEGESLDKILKEYGVQDEERVIEWAKQICDALSYLHSQKPRPIVYRDMKPANIMLKPEGNIKIIDFGIAREYKEQNLADTKVLGTRGFAPPEAYNGQTTPRSDIYSLGMTMHNLLTGVDPRMGDGYVPVRQLNPNLSEGIELIIDKCVQPAEENRYQSCADLIYDLEHPDLITSGYKKKQKRKLVATIVPFVLSIVMAFTGIGTAIGASAAKKTTYTTLVNNGEFEKAIIKIPDKCYYYDEETGEKYDEEYTAYEKMLEHYENLAITDPDGELSEDEVDELLQLWGQYKDVLKKAHPDRFADINFRVGEICLLYGVDKKEACTFILPLFEEAEELDKEYGGKLEYKYKKRNHQYYLICDYQVGTDPNNQKKKIATQKESEELLKVMSQVVTDLVAEVERDPNAEYVLIHFCSMAFDTLDEKMGDFKKVHIKKETVKAAGEDIYNALNKVDADKNTLNKLKSDAVEYYETFNKKISATYNDSKSSK